ncbi:uncharacterized protein LOC130626949 [Hydractinia symbiolongicarpus]|uniref:uncharacterized protein LOC130626949 n=1 Tax=Hydractinia symbiolongicarpus TaxID=13093 RepID=UPI00254D886D|nr:uncharacterized protein LOC130626949 [Hydractinia symbiolongicarpus]
MNAKAASLFLVVLVVATTYLFLEVRNKHIQLFKPMALEKRDYETLKCNTSETNVDWRIHTITIELPNNKVEYFHYLPNLRKDKRNMARIAYGECVSFEGMKVHKNNNQMILMTDFIPYFEKFHRDKSVISKKRPPTDEEIDARLYELVETLQGNLNHENIKSVFVFVDSNQAVEYLNSLNLMKSKNLVIHHLSKQHTIKSLFEYAEKCFMDEIVIFGQQDILFGKGWDLVNYKVMSEKRIMYALTRQPAYNSNCYNTWVSTPNCKTTRYLGSHDVFVYHVKGIFTPAILKTLDFEQNKYGIENFIIWLFRDKLQYEVTNPCLVLNIHHQHCVPLRAKETTRERVNNATTTGMAEFPAKL